MSADKLLEGLRSFYVGEAKKEEPPPVITKSKVKVPAHKSSFHGLSTPPPPAGKASFIASPAGGIFSAPKTPGYTQTNKPYPTDVGINQISYSVTGRSDLPKTPAGEIKFGATMPSSEEGVANIKKVLNLATPLEMQYQRDWYRHAHDIAQGLATRYAVPLQAVAGIIAVMSPGLDPAENYKAANDVLARKWGSIINAKNKGFLQKAVNILAKGDVDAEVNGPKVTAFYQSIYDPDATQNIAVLDGHALNIWRGTPVPITDNQIPPAWRDAIERDYGTAGKSFGLSAQEAQAVSWYVWRLMMKKKPLGLRPPTAFQPLDMAMGEPSRPGTQFPQPAGTTSTRFAPPSFMKKSMEATDVSALPLIDELRSLLK